MGCDEDGCLDYIIDGTCRDTQSGKVARAQRSAVLCLCAAFDIISCTFQNIALLPPICYRCKLDRAEITYFEKRRRYATPQLDVIISRQILTMIPIYPACLASHLCNMTM